MTPIFYGLNILETWTVTVSGEAAGKPKERLFDRDVGLPWQDTSSAGDRILKAARGAQPAQSLDTWAVAAGHNLSGATLTWESSPDDAIWTVRDTFVPSDASAILRSISPLTFDFWRLKITGASTAPSISELFFTLKVAVTGYLSENGMRQGLVGNVAVQMSVAGYVWGAQLGVERWAATYPLRELTTADKAALEALFQALKGGTKFLWVKDADGVVRWVRWETVELGFFPVPVDRWMLDVELVEAL
jgi:hypothetical protein